MNSKITNFKDLKIWQKGIELVKVIYQITNSFPSTEMYGIVSQMRRSAISIPSNIAEGFHRQNQKEKIQFYHVASGSIAELETQLMIANDVDYIDGEIFKNVITQAAKVHQLTYGLIRSTRNWR